MSYEKYEAGRSPASKQDYENHENYDTQTDVNMGFEDEKAEYWHARDLNTLQNQEVLSDFDAMASDYNPKDYPYLEHRDGSVGGPYEHTPSPDRP